MSTPNDGGQAFPHGDPTNGGDVGMSLRDWFAGKAMEGLIASGSTYDGKHNVTALCKDAYLYADALLAERAKSHARAL